MQLSTKKECTLKVLILGANGQIAQVATELFLERTDVQLTLFLRRAKRLSITDPTREKVVEGDVLDLKALESAVAGQDVVYANLSGSMKQQAQNIVAAMKNAGVKRLIFISSMGIYGEVPGERYRSVLDLYRDSAQLIEASGLEYTIIRPAWLNDNDEISYGTTQKGQSFENASAVVSRKSVADLVVRLATTPGLGVSESFGIHKRS